LGKIGETLTAFSGFEGLAILGASFLIWLVEIWRWKFILKSHGEDLPFFQLGEILLASFSLFYLFSSAAILGAEGFRIYAFKKKFSIAWEKSLAISIIERILRASMMLLFLIPGAIAFPLLTKVSLNNYGLTVAGLIGVLSLALIFFYYRSLKNKSIFGWFLKIFSVKKNVTQKIEKEIFHFFDFRKPLLWKGLGITFLKYSLILFRVWLILIFLKGLGVNFLLALTILFFIYLSYLLPLPAGLGVLEASQLIAFSALGLGTAAGISFSFIIRGAELVVALFGLVLLIKLGIKFFMGNIKNIISKFSFKN